MATENKDFRVKNGLVVEGSTATVNGNNVLTTASSLDSLGDVVITSATNGQVLKYNGTNWINDTDATGGGGGAINDLTDVTISSVSDNEILQYDSGTSQWINQTISEAGLVSGVGTAKISYQTTAPTSPTTGDIWIDSDAEGLQVLPQEPANADTAKDFGYIGIPQVSTSTGINLTAAHAGKHIYTTTTGQTHTIPANSSVPLEIGTTIVFINAASVSTSIAITSDTLLLAGAGTTGTRTLAEHGMATAIKITDTSWIISGNGLT